MKGKIRWIIIFVSLFMIVSLSRSVVDLWERRSILVQEQMRLSEAQKRHDELSDKLQKVQTPAFVEQEARERLGMAKEGETVILMDTTGEDERPADAKAMAGRLKTEDRGRKTDDGGQKTEERKESNWKQWWGVFF